MLSVDSERRTLIRWSLRSFEVFVSLLILDVASRSFAKDIPRLVMQEVILTHSILMLFSFLPLVYSGSERSCGPHPPIIQ